MVLLEHLPLLGLALSFAHHNHGRASHDHPALLNHRPVAQISADISRFHQAPKMIAARASDESQETTIQVSQHHLETILDRIKSLEEEIFHMMLSKADFSLESTSTPTKYASNGSAALTPAKPEKIVVTTREPKAAPATAIIGGLFKESPVGLDALAVFDEIFTTTVTSTTRITRTVTIVPTRIVTLTTFASNLAKESKSKALIPFANGTASGNPPRTTLLSANIETERGPSITPPSFNASTSFHHVSLSAAPSGFRTVRRAA